MDRRNFLRNSLLTCGALAGPQTAHGDNSANAPRPGAIHIQYIQENVPSFEVPSFRGESYADKVPDTMEVTERAKLAVHGITSITDPNADEEIYWLSDFARNPPTLVHNFNDWVQLAEGLQESLPLLRNATGDSINNQVDPVWMKVLLQCIGPDGLVYIPLQGRPWGRMAMSDAIWSTVWRADGSSTKPSDKSITQIAAGSVQARVMGMLAVYYLRDNNPMWKQKAEGIVQRLSELAIEKDDYAYLSGFWEPNAKVSPGAEMFIKSAALETNGRVIQGLSQYYKVTGYEPAIVLAGKLTRYFRDHCDYYDSESRFLPEPGGPYGWPKKPGLSAEETRFGGHSHSHALGLLCMLEYATATNDRATVQFVTAGFEWAKKQNEAFGVSDLIGWFPVWFAPTYPIPANGREDSQTRWCESCTVGDMLGVAVKLSEAGAGDYWDNIDRWVRNHFAEAQLQDPSWIYRMAEGRPGKPVLANETGDRAPERSVGLWAAGADPNDWGAPLVADCCTGNMSRGVYYVWEHMLDHSNGELRVNLLLNRASAWADVYSYIPYQGRVDLKMKQSCRSVKVRAPEWVETGSPELVATVNGAQGSLHWDGRYVDLGPRNAGDAVSVTFPIHERTVREKIGPYTTYLMVVKGNTVVGMTPPGNDGAFYKDRAKYREGDVQWKTVQRFVSEQQIIW